MATRKSLVIVSGLFQELNTSADKLDLGGNTSTDIPSLLNTSPSPRDRKTSRMPSSA